MENYFNWLERNAELLNKPWLVLGKGPSFSKYIKSEYRDYFLVGLNDVVRETRVDILHVMDIAVIERLGELALKNCKYLLIPWFPHEDYSLPFLDKTFHKASTNNLDYYVIHNSILKEFSKQNRLLWYDASSAKECGPGPEKVVNAGPFSAATVTRLIALSGVKKIRTLGVDGGQSYSTSFSDLEGETLLDSGQESFNLQFADMAKTIRETNVDLAPADIESPVKVYVGTQPEQMLATKVLEYSIKKHASISVEVIPLHTAIDNAKIKYRSVAGKTPFSFQRFAIPMLKKFKGKAIYVDSDMQVFSDIRELWTWPMKDSQILAVHERTDDRKEPQFSVMVLNCEQLDWDVDKICEKIENCQVTYEDIVYKMSLVDRISYGLPTRWNDLEHYKNGVTSLIHYTDMVLQPWITTNNKLARIWCEELIDAVAEGFIALDDIKEQIGKGWVRPSLQYQIENNIADPQLIPKKILKKLDANYVPPFHLIKSLRSIVENPNQLSLAQKLKLWSYARLYNLWVESSAQYFYKKLRKTCKKVKIAIS